MQLGSRLSRAGASSALGLPTGAPVEHRMRVLAIALDRLGCGPERPLSPNLVDAAYALFLVRSEGVPEPAVAKCDAVPTTEPSDLSRRDGLLYGANPGGLSLVNTTVTVDALEKPDTRATLPTSKGKHMKPVPQEHRDAILTHKELEKTWAKVDEDLGIDPKTRRKVLAGEPVSQDVRDAVQRFEKKGRSVGQKLPPSWGKKGKKGIPRSHRHLPARIALEALRCNLNLSKATDCP